MSRSFARPVAAAVAAVVVAVVAAVLAVPAPAAQQAPEASDEAARNYFTDTVLINQDGEEMRFYSDLLRDRVVVINVLFTECTGSCPVMSRKYASLQDHLGDQLGDQVHLISISVDPANDSPADLKRHAEKFGAREGWYLLTGREENVRTVLGKLGQWVDDPATHQNLFLIGNDRTGLWKKAFGLAPTGELVEIVDSVVDDTGATPPRAG